MLQRFYNHAFTDLGHVDIAQAVQAQGVHHRHHHHPRLLPLLPQRGVKTARTSVKSTFSGLLLMLGYLGFDGFTNTFQDKLFEGYDMPAANQVLYITLCSSVISLLGESLLLSADAGSGQ
ncbi:unnamed protein product [Closterium sp. NIES-54]